MKPHRRSRWGWKNKPKLTTQYVMNVFRRVLGFLWSRKIHSSSFWIEASLIFSQSLSLVGQYCYFTVPSLGLAIFLFDRCVLIPRFVIALWWQIDNTEPINNFITWHNKTNYCHEYNSVNRWKVRCFFSLPGWNKW